MIEDDGDGLWIQRGDVWAGVALGGAAVARSFQPSFLPRTTANQALLSGVAGAAGFALGNATYGWFVRSGDARTDASVLAGVAGAAGAARLLTRQHDDERLPRAWARAGADALLIGSCSAGAVATVRYSRRPLRTALVLGGLGAAAAGTDIVRGVRGQLRHPDRHDAPPPRALPAVARSATIGGGLAAVVNGFRLSGRGATRMLEHRVGMAPTPAFALGHGVAVGIWAGVLTAFADTFLKGMALYDRVVDPGYDRAPTEPTRSTGPGSPLTFSRTGRHGRRFVLDVAGPDEIESVMGRPAVAAPVRVFVGYDSARSAEDRVRLAMEELERTGGFDRSVLIVGSPAGTGWVNNLPFEVADHLTLGDCTGVAIQYHRLPSLIALPRLSDGGHHHRLLLEAVAARLARVPRAERPRLLVYGESLGAWAGQNAFLHRGVAGLDELGVERALWSGTPYYSGWAREALGAGIAGDRTDPKGLVVEVERPEDLVALGPEGLARVRAVLLSNHNDPIRKLGAHLLVQRPPWFSDPAGSFPTQTGFLPFVTAAQIIVDTFNATNPTPGEFRATGHDYRSTLPRTTQLAFDLPDPGPEVWARLVRHLEAREAERAARFRLPSASRTTSS